MKNLTFDKGNIKKLALCVGLGGIITFSSIYGLKIKGYNSFGEVADDVKSSVGSFLSDNNCYNNTNNLSSEEFLKEFENIYNNSESLQSEWSGFYPELKDFISNYGEYLDQNEILKLLPELKISAGTHFSSDDVMAEYDRKDNEIRVSSRLPYKKADEIKKTMFHETLHFIFQDGFYESSSKYKRIGYMLDEGLVSLLNQEYGIYEGGDNYMKASNYVRVLCELIGEDKFMKAAGREGIEYLIKELSVYSSDSDAKNLISNINMASADCSKKGTSNDKEAWKIINKIYSNKHGVSIENSEDELMKVYSNKTLGSNYDITGTKYSNRASANKNYFANKGNSSIIIKVDSTTNTEILLDESNRAKSR